MTKAGTWVAALVLTGTALAAQAPLLQVQAGEHGFTVTNVYSVTATAYVLRQSSAAGHGAMLSGITADAVSHPQVAIAPGSSRQVGLAARGGDGVTEENLAVIYADGTSAGDPKLIEQFLRVRGFRLRDCATVLATLARADESSDIPALQAELFHEAGVEDAERRAAGLRPPMLSGNLMHDLAGMLSGVTNEPPARRGWILESLRKRYRKEQSELLASLPAPILPDPPVETNSSPPAGTVSCGQPGPSQPELTCTPEGTRMAVIATNRRTVTATAVVLEAHEMAEGTACGARVRLADGRCIWPLGEGVFDFLLHMGNASREDLQPGGQVHEDITVHGTWPVVVEASIIYADGITVGDPEAIARVLRRRKETLADLEQVIPILESALRDPNASQAALEATFQQRADRYRDETRTRHDSDTFDLVCGNIAMMLRAPDQGRATPPLAQQISSWLRDLAITMRRLQASP